MPAKMSTIRMEKLEEIQMNHEVLLKSIMDSPVRTVSLAKAGDADLGPLKHLPGTWESKGKGFNMIALPFAHKDLNYRLLINKYDETLKFTTVDKRVPNRGVRKVKDNSLLDLPDHHEDEFSQADQFVATLDYEQSIKQTDAEDFPVSGKAGGAGLAIHHEPGLWLYMVNEATNGFDIARLSTIPHGDSVLALGKSLQNVVAGGTEIDEIHGLPVGYPMSLETDSYLHPYKHFHDGHFHGFDPVNPHKMLEEQLKAVKASIVRTTILTVDTTVDTAGIRNIPFIVRQANAASMKSTFWIHELASKNAAGNPKLLLQYAQVVMLDFFAREDGLPGLIGWPHVSINTLEKVC